MTPQTLLSFVIPVMDEEATIHILHARIIAEVERLGHDCELIFIDDGSRDTSWHEIELLCAMDPRVRGIRFRRNMGKANALTAGFECARGEVVFTMDADLQDDPAEIGRFLEKLDEGFDVISGWKKTRHDPWHKVLPSRVFNGMISRLIGVRLHDHNCGFKCYRAPVVKAVTLYGEMHRMVPSLASLHGYGAAEIAVKHHPRMHGVSKYGVKRFLRGFMDLLTVYFLKNYRERPLHIYGGSAAVTFALGVALLAASFARVLHSGGAAVGAACLVIGVVLAALGFIAELLINRRTRRDRDLPISETIGSPHASAHRANVEVGAADDAAEGAPLVLLVDDDPRVRAMYRFHLEDHGYRVAEATNGVEAIAKITPEVAVVLLDMEMPGGHGLDALRKIRSHNAMVKVIMVSGREELDGAIAAMKLGAFDYLAKPMPAEHLVGTVTRAVQIQSLTARHLLAA